jgi:hypothetical protein
MVVVVVPITDLKTPLVYRSLIFLVSFFFSLVSDHFIVSYLPRKKEYDHKENIEIA